MIVPKKNPKSGQTCNRIIEILEQSGHLTAKQIADAVGVQIACARRNILNLLADGKLEFQVGRNDRNQEVKFWKLKNG